MSTQLDTLRRYVANRPLPELPEAPEQVLLVGSGKGGVGTSTIAALVAIMAAADGQEVLLVDADENHGSLPLLFGIKAQRGLGALRGGEAAPADLLVALGHGLSLLPLGGTAEPQDRIATAERRGLMRRIAALYGRYDLVVVDTGSRLAQVTDAVAAGAGRLLAVTAAERVSAAATYALVKAVNDRQPELPIDLLFNRCRLSTATHGFEEIDAATRHFLRRGLAFAGGVPDDERLRTAIDGGMPMQEAAGFGTPATAACHELAANIVRQFEERDAARLRRAQDFSPAVETPRLPTRR